MTEAELKQLVERALDIDALICKEHFGLAWERPHMAFMEHSGPIQPQKHQAVSQSFQSGQALQRSQRMVDTSVGPDTKSTDVEMHKEGTEVQSESGAEVEEGKLSMETLKKVKELLCDESVRNMLQIIGYCCRSLLSGGQSQIHLNYDNMAKITRDGVYLSADFVTFGRSHVFTLNAKLSQPTAGSSYIFIYIFSVQT